jgi:2-oxoglutarate ferredoxin oxidoreductase subunit delta
MVAGSGDVPLVSPMSLWIPAFAGMTFLDSSRFSLVFSTPFRVPVPNNRMETRFYRMPIVIDRKKCKGCALCVDACPKAIIVQGRELNDAGYQFVVCDDPEKKCNACTLCAVMCPDMCIEVYREEKGASAAKADQAKETRS